MSEQDDLFTPDDDLDEEDEAAAEDRREMRRWERSAEGKVVMEAVRVAKQEAATLQRALRLSKAARVQLAPMLVRYDLPSINAHMPDPHYLWLIGDCCSDDAALAELHKHGLLTYHEETVDNPDFDDFGETYKGYRCNHEAVQRALAKSNTRKGGAQ
jgi:hypothetical protein